MGERQSGPLGLQLHLDPKFAPGFPVSGLPLRLVLPAPLGSSAWHSGAAVNRSRAQTQAGSSGAVSALDKFKKALIAKQVAAREAQGKKAVLEIPVADLKQINGEKDKLLHKDVTVKFDAMWAEAHKEHANRTGAAKGDSIGVASAYRSAKDDERAWQGAFPKYYKNTLKQREATGDEFGSKSLDIIFRYMNGKKAPPGFSGHTHGIAVDLTTKENGKSFVVNSDYDHQLGWQKTWLYQWLVANAGKHKFYQLKSETWHWEYHAGRPPSQCWGGDVKQRPVPKPKK